MPKYYCDYCDRYLTHDSPSVRKTHVNGKKHRDSVREYYQKWLEQQVQRINEEQARQAKRAAKIGIAPMAYPSGPVRMAMPPPAFGAPPPGFGMPPPGFGMPPPAFGGAPPPFVGLPPPAFGAGMMPPGGIPPNMQAMSAMAKKRRPDDDDDDKDDSSDGDYE